MAVILLRHTRPEGGEGVCYGRTDLPPAPGHEAEWAALAAALPTFAAIVTSPLTRCLALARHLAEQRACPLLVEPRLAEMDFGSWEGLAWDEVPRSGLEDWARDLNFARPHGGENVAMLRDRAVAALGERTERPLLVVTHAGVIRALLSVTRGDAGLRAAIGFGEWLLWEDASC